MSDKDISREFQSRLFKIFDSLIFTNFPISRQLGDKKRTEAWYYETLMSVHSSRLWLKTLVLDAYCVHVKDDCVSQAMEMPSDPSAERHLDVGNLIVLKPRLRFPSARTLQKRAVVFAKRTRYINWRFEGLPESREKSRFSRKYSGCYFNLGLGHNCDYREALGNESPFDRNLAFEKFLFAFTINSVSSVPS